VHEASALKVDEGDLFLVANAPHGRRKRPRGCSAENGCAAILAAHAPHGGRRRPRYGGLFPSLTLLMAAAWQQKAAA